MPGINGNTPQAYLNGSWKNWEAVSGNIDGTWRTASDVYQNHNGTWKHVWVRLTGPTNGSTSLSHVTATISWTAGVGQEGFKLYRNGVFVKNVAANATSTTDIVPAMYQNYTYTVSAYAGSTETAQISCGSAVQATVGQPTAYVSITRNWGYVNDSWDGQSLQATTSCSAVPNATGYVYLHPIYNVEYGGPNTGVTFDFGANETRYFSWRAYVVHNGQTYYGPGSNIKTVTTGQPQIRTARTDDVSFSAWRDLEEYYSAFGTANSINAAYSTVGTIVDSYQWRNLTCTFETTINSSSRSVTFVRPNGGNVTVTPTSTPNGYNSPVYTNYIDGTYRCDLGGLGWYTYASTNKLNGIMRFNTRYISQSAIAATSN